MICLATSRSPHGNVAGDSHFQPNDQQRPTPYAVERKIGFPDHGCRDRNQVGRRLDCQRFNIQRRSKSTTTANKRSPHGNVAGDSHFQPNDQQRPNDLRGPAEDWIFRNHDCRDRNQVGRRLDCQARLISVSIYRQRNLSHLLEKMPCSFKFAQQTLPRA